MQRDLVGPRDYSIIREKIIRERPDIRELIEAKKNQMIDPLQGPDEGARSKKTIDNKDVPQPSPEE